MTKIPTTDINLRKKRADWYRKCLMLSIRIDPLEWCEQSTSIVPHSGLCLLVRQKNELKTPHIFREHILIILILVLFILYRSHQDDSAYHQNQESIRYKDYKPQRYTFDIELLSEQPRASFCISEDPKNKHTYTIGSWTQALFKTVLVLPE
jgi:hypothetical protein